MPCKKAFLLLYMRFYPSVMKETMNLPTRLLGALSLALALLAPCAYGADPAIVYVVRHAEKTGNDGDPDLTARGHARAASIAAILKKAGIGRVYTTRTARTRQTAAPMASSLGIAAREYDARQPAPMVAEVRAAGGRTLVVGHSNTVPQLVSLFGGTPGPDIGDDEYDRLYQLLIGADGSVTTVLLSSPPSD